VRCIDVHVTPLQRLRVAPKVRAFLTPFRHHCCAWHVCATTTPKSNTFEAPKRRWNCIWQQGTPLATNVATRRRPFSAHPDGVPLLSKCWDPKFLMMASKTKILTGICWLIYSISTRLDSQGGMVSNPGRLLPRLVPKLWCNHGRNLGGRAPRLHCTPVTHNLGRFSRTCVDAPRLLTT
jgi:hypothetical protein